MLVLGGPALGFVPGCRCRTSTPTSCSSVFLPPLLYAAAFQASAYELRANALAIGTLAVGLVVVTMVAVAAVAHWVAGLPWVVAFVLGAVLGPTDPVAAAAVMRRVGAPPRIQTILEGESLVNDATGLTAYSLALGAVGAVGAASLSAGGVLGEFLQVEVLDAERDVLGEMRCERAFPPELLRELEAELDVDEARVRSRGR